MMQQVDRTHIPPIEAVPIAIRQPETCRLGNGMPLHIIRAEGQQAVRVDWVIGAGQWHQTMKLQALFANRMLREGCEGYTSAAFAERLDYYGAWMELSVSMTRSFVTLYTLKKHFAPTMELIRRMLTAPAYDEGQLNLIKKNNKDNFLVNLQKGNVMALRAFREAVYGPEHPCGQNAEAADFDRLTAAKLREYYERYYSSANCEMYVTGDVDEAMMTCVQQTFGDEAWGHSEPVPALSYAVKPCSEQQLWVPKEDAQQCSLRMGALWVPASHADYLPLRVLVTVLGGYFGSRLMKNIREDKGYTYHIGADMVPQPGQVMFSISSEALVDKSEAVVTEVAREMERLRNEPIPQAEMDMVRNYMLGELCRSYEGAYQLSDADIFIRQAGLPTDYVERLSEVIAQVQPDTLQALAQKYLRMETMKRVTVGPIKYTKL